MAHILPVAPHAERVLLCDPFEKEKATVTGCNLATASEIELLSLIVSKPAATRILDVYETLDAALFRAPGDGLGPATGVGEECARKLGAVAEIATRMLKPAFHEGTKIRGAEDVFDLVRDMQFLEHEQMRAIYLDSRNAVLAIEIITGFPGPATPRQVFHHAMRLMASAVIIAHNHITGDPTPSPDDYALTEQLRDAGCQLGVTVFDHVIVGRGRYVALQREGLL